MPQSPPQEAGIEQEFWENQAAISGRPRRRVDAGADVRASGPAMPPRPAFVVDPHDGLLGRVTERIRDWRGDPRVGVVALVLVAVVAGVVWYRIGIGGGADSSGAAPSAATHTARSTTTATTSAPGASGSAKPTTATSAKIVVHVAGAVTHAGVVELGANARVIDAIEAVGGAQADGDLDRLNLAAKLVDGERVYVAKVGQADPGVAADGSGEAGGTGTGAPGAKINLNTATQAQLESLPGIGPTYAQAIIAERQARGGFKSVNELRNVRGIGDKRFSELEPLVTV